MDEKDKEELENEIINLKGEVATLRAYVKTLSLLMIPTLEKTHGVSNEEAYELFVKTLSQRLSVEVNRVIDSTSLDDEIRSLFEDD